jgi:hypothetical protein
MIAVKLYTIAMGILEVKGFVDTMVGQAYQSLRQAQ